MLRPTPGELLNGLRRELKDQVLPALPPGAVARQLRAALHVLDQLARTWDLQHSYLEADNADLEITIARLSRRTGLLSRSAAPMTAIPNTTDRALCKLIARNGALQSELETWQRDWRASERCDEEVDHLLLALHMRMASRAALAGGVCDEG